MHGPTRASMRWQHSSGGRDGGGRAARLTGPQRPAERSVRVSVWVLVCASACMSTAMVVQSPRARVHTWASGDVGQVTVTAARRCHRSKTCLARFL